MCGRYTLTSPHELAEELGVGSIPDDVIPRYNLAPSQPAPVVANHSRERVVELFRWGLVPAWADDPSVGYKMINARLETAATRPAFRDPLRRRRCLVPADGFFEWRREGRRKVPFLIRPEPRRIIAFAGLWERWKAPDGSWLLSFAILTGDANDLVRPLHDRMPVVVEREDHDRWLSPDELPPEALDDILRPPPAAGWVAYEVSPLVNSADNDRPECIEAGPVQQRLF
jgi:putative SOS response-associated peptidase YedK